MVWPDYLGLDVEPVRALANKTASWQDSVDAALAELDVAERVSGHAAGVTGAIDQIARDGKALSAALTKAVDEVESFQVSGATTQWSSAMDGMVAGVNNPVEASRTTAAPDPYLAEVWALLWESGGRSQASQTAAQDGLVAGGPSDSSTGQTSGRVSPTEWEATGSPKRRVDQPIDFSQVTQAVDSLAAEVARLNTMAEAGVDLARRDEAWRELTQIARMVTFSEAGQLGQPTGTWVSIAVANVAHEWKVDYDRAALLHRRDEILAQTPTVALHYELLAIGAAIARSRRSEPIVSGPEARLAQLTDRALIDAIDGWNGSDTAAAFGLLVQEFQRRVAPLGPLGTGRYDVWASRMRSQATGHPPILDAAGEALAVELQAQGFHGVDAETLAALMRLQFPGTEVAVYRGYQRAITYGPDELAALGTETVEAFDALVEYYGRDAVLALNRPMLDAALATIESSARFAAEPLDAQTTIAIVEFALRQSITIAAAARHYYDLGIDGSTYREQRLTDLEVAEFHLRIDQVDQMIIAVNGLPRLGAVLAGSGTFGGDTAWEEQVRQRVADQSKRSPSSEVLDALAAHHELLVQAQLAVWSAGKNPGMDPLDDEQIALIDRLAEHEQELLELRGPRMPEWGVVLPPVLGATGIDGTPYIYPGRWDRPVAVAEIRDILARYDAELADPLRPEDRVISGELAATLRAILDDPEVVSALAPRIGGSPFAPIEDVEAISFGTASHAAVRNFLAEVLAPYEAQIDAIRPGQVPDGVISARDLPRFLDAIANDPTVPRLVVEAVEAMRSAGHVDLTLLDLSHLILDTMGSLPLPAVSQAADAVNGGLYLLVDRDATEAALTLAPIPVSALRNAGTIAHRLRGLDWSDETGMIRVAAPGGGTVEIPHGFDDLAEFDTFGRELRDGLAAAGYSDVQPVFQGSAVTGFRYSTGEAFDVRKRSDFDIALADPELLDRARYLGIELRSRGTRTEPLTREHLRALGLEGLVRRLSDLAGRKVSLMIYGSVDGAVGRSPSLTFGG